MAKFFSKVKNWFSRHLPTKRRLIQLYVALLYNANIKGYVTGTISQSKTKYACVPGLNCYSCPGAVGACPLGALQNAFAQSGTRAGYYVLGIIGLYGIIFARTVCGFLCPVGLLQELLNMIPSFKINKSKVTRVLSYLKYVVLAVLVIGMPLLYGLQGIAVPGFCKYICPAGTFEGGIGLLLNPANWSGSRDLLNMLGSIFTWKFALLVGITVLCVFMYRPFCRFLCPLGAIYGFFNKIAFLGVKVDHVKCTNCGLCVKHCQMDVKCVGDHECINCGKCMKVCPVQAISFKGSGLFNKNNAEVVEDEYEDEVGAPVRTVQASFQPAYATAGAQPVATVVADTAATTNEMLTRQGDPPPNAAPVKRRKRDKKFWIEVVAWSLALVLLVGSFVYFNFVQKDSNVEKFAIGDPCPDFTLSIYGPNELNKFVLLDEQFTLSEQLGSVVVVNFWATWCGPCVAELPHFNEVAKQFPEVKVVAIHGSSSEDVGSFITRKTPTKDSWRNYNVTFLQDVIEGSETCLTFQALGGNSTWPMTLIVGKDGKITYIKQGSLTHAKLQSEVEKALNA